MGQQQPSAQNASQPTQDYSKAWEEYFKRTGQHAQAAAVAAQSGGASTKSEPATSSPAQHGSGQGGTQDYSAQWAEYYRKLAEYQRTNGSQQ